MICIVPQCFHLSVRLVGIQCSSDGASTLYGPLTVSRSLFWGLTGVDAFSRDWGNVQDSALKIGSDYMGPRRRRILIQRRTSMMQHFLGFATDHDDDTTPHWIWGFLFFDHFHGIPWGIWTYHLGGPALLWILSSRSASRCSLFFLFLSSFLQNFHTVQRRFH